MATSTPAASAIDPPPPTLRDLAVQAATQANLNSFSSAYSPDPDQAARLADTFDKACPALTRLINLCDSGLVKQMGLFKPTTNELVVLSCPHPATHPTTKENLLAGSLGDALDIICPVTIGMHDVKGHVISVATSKTVAIDTFHLPASTSDPLSEEGPTPSDGTEAEQAGPDRIFIEVNDPSVAPCFALFPKVFPFPGRYSIASTARNPATTSPPTTPAFDMWRSAMLYGIQHLQNHSIQGHDTLFDYDNIEKTAFDETDRDLATHFTTTITYLTPDDPLYHAVTKYSLLEKERAIITYGSHIAPSTPPPRNHSPAVLGTTTHVTTSPTSVSDMSAIIDGLSKAITNSKSLTGTERERQTEAEEVLVHFYQLLLASVHEVLQSDGTTKTTLVKAELNPLFVKGVLQANKNSKATKAMQQDLIEETTSSLSTQDTRFAAACNLIPRMFDQPLVAALRSGTWAHQPTVLHPDGIKTHFGLHHLASPRTWSVLYKTRMEGEMMLVRQEQVEEDKSKLQAKTTDLYHMGKMGSLADIHELIGNFFGLINAIASFDPSAPPAIWLEILAFEKILRTLEGRQWFDLHRNLREVPFNVVQDIQSTLAGFAAEARKPGYRSALSTGIIISPRIFHLAMQQGIELRRTLQSTILTMAAGHFNLVPLTYKFFHPEQLTRDASRKRENNNPAGDNPNPPSRQRPSPAGPPPTPSRGTVDNN